MKAVIYARYSSHSQRDESIEGQLRECYDFAKKNEIKVIGEYIDRAISGKTDARPDFQRLIKDSEHGRFDAVIMYTLDRFARNRYDSAIYKAKLKKNGVRIFYAKQPMPDTPEGIILESVLEGYAEYYSENLSRGIKRGLKENALHGIVAGSVPLGYEMGEDRKYKIDPVGAEAVRIIFDRYSEGATKKSITDYLNEKGYKTSKGGKFNKGSLKSILSNKKYIGVLEYSGDVIPEGISPIIDKETFEKVQKLLDKNHRTGARRKSKETYLLTTKLFCGHCKEPMIGESGASKSGRVYRYYKCTSQKRKKTCSKKPVKKEDIEYVVINAVIEKILTDENIKAIADAAYNVLKKEREDDSLLKSLERDLRDCEKKIENILKAIENGIFNDLTKSRLDELNDVKNEIITQIELEKIQKPDITSEMIEYWLDQFKKGDINEESYRQRIIDTLVNSVYIYDDDNGDGEKLDIICNLTGDNARIECSIIKSESPLFGTYPNTFRIAGKCVIISVFL